MSTRLEMRAVTLSTATVALLLCHVAVAQGAAVLENLTVEYRTTPIGIDVPQPRFAWQMDAPESERGAAQTAYRIVVRDPGGAVVWDSTRTESRESLAIPYQGTPVKAATRVLMDRDRVEPGPPAVDGELVVRDGSHGPGAGLSCVGGRAVDRRRRRRPRPLRALPRNLRRALRRDHRTGQQPRELRLRRERLAVDGSEQERLPARECQGRELHQAGARRFGAGRHGRRHGEAPCLPCRLRADGLPVQAIPYLPDRVVGDRCR